MALCAALILGMLPSCYPAQAAATTDTSAKIVVDKSESRHYYEEIKASDLNANIGPKTPKLDFKPRSEVVGSASAPSPNKVLTLGDPADEKKLTFSNEEKEGRNVIQMAYVPFSVEVVNVPAYTTRTYDITFSLDLGMEVNSSKYYLFAEVIKGPLSDSYSFNTDEGETEDRLYYKKDSSTLPAKKEITIEDVTFENKGKTAASVEASFVFFCGHSKITEGLLFESLSTFNCTLKDATYDPAKDKKTLNFDANGGTVSETSKTVDCEKGCSELPTPATRTGYEFDGWYTEKIGGTKVDSDSALVALSGGSTLYAHWTANKYTVTFKENGGDTLPSSSASKEVTYDSTYGTLPTPTRAGYTFDGWYTAASGGNQVTDSTKVSQVTDHALYAHWTVATYTITFSGAASGSGSQSYTYGQTGTVAFPKAADQSGSGKFFTGWKLTVSPDKNPTVNGTAVNTSTLYQPGQALVFTGGAYGDMTFTAQYTEVTGTSSVSETLTIKGQSSIPAPPAKSTYTVKVTGNDSLKALTIGGVSVTRSGTEDFVLTTTESGSKTVVIDGENAGSVIANGTLTVTYKTLTVTINANKAVTLSSGPDLARSGPAGGVYTYTHTARDPGSSTYRVLVDGEDTGKTARYGGKTELAYHTATATVTVQSGASVNSVELVNGSKVMAMGASGSGKYSCTGMNGSGTYTLRVNGTPVSGQTTDFSVNKSLAATIYAKKITTKLNGTAADIPGVGNVKIGGLSAARTGVGTYLATQVGTSIGSTVSINGANVTVADGVVDYYTVSYNANGGTGAPVDGNVYLKGAKAGVLARGGMAKKGCSFLGWTKDGTDIAVGASVTVNGQTTFTARWQENASSEVRWQVPGGEPQYGTLTEALDAAGITPDVTITVQDGRTAHLPADRTLPESAALIVPAGTKVVSDGDGAVLTVEGRIENAGSFDAPVGTLHIKESGTLVNMGTVLWDIKPNAGRIDNTGGTISGDVENTDGGTVEGGTVSGTVTGGTVTGPITDEGTIQDAVITGPVDLPGGGKIIDSVVDGTVADKGGELTYTKEIDSSGVIMPPGGSGTGSTPVQKLVDALGGAAVESPTGTVKLVADVDLTTEPIIIDDDVVIDLNGHTINAPDGKPAIQVGEGDVTIQDSSDPDSGSIIGGSGSEGQPGAPGIENKGDGTVTIEGGTVSGGTGGIDGDGGAGIKNTGDGDVVIDGGTVTGGSGGGGEPGGKGGSGIENTGSGKVSIDGGKVEGGTGTGTGEGGDGVGNTGDGSVNVAGGEVTGGTGGRTGEGEGGQGGGGVGGSPDRVTIDPDASVSAGKGGTGGDGTVTLRSVAPSIDAIPDQLYTGGEITPAVVLRDGADVIPASEYVVEYKENVNPGTATVTIKDKPDKENALYKLADATTTFEIKVKSGATYQVTLNGNGGSGGTALTSYTYGTAVALPKDWTRTGYTFAGWYDNEDCTGTAVTEITAEDVADKVYWAKWTINTYTVTLSSGEGYTLEAADNDSKSPVSYGGSYRFCINVAPGYNASGMKVMVNGSEVQVSLNEANEYEYTINDITEDKEVVVTVPAHSFGEWKTTKAASCIADGTKEHICSRCGKKETAAIPATGHTFPGQWTVEKEATESETGRQYKICETCGTKLYQTIDPLKIPVNPNAGKIEKEVEVLPGAPDTVLNDSKEELAQSVLTEAEIAEIDSGTDAKIWLEIAPDVEIAEKEKAQVQKIAEESVGAGAEVTYFDVSLF